MLLEVKNLIKKCVDRVKIIDKSWGTHDISIVSKPTLGASIFILAVSMFLWYVAYKSDDLFYRWFILYASLTAFIVLFYLLILYKYVNHRPFKYLLIGKVLHRLCESLFVLMAIFEIPSFALLLIVYWIVGYRAKKIDLFLAWVEIVAFDLIFVLLLLAPIVDFSIWGTKNIIKFLGKTGESSSEPAIRFFMIILLMFVAVNIFNIFVLWVIKKRWKKSNEQKAHKMIPQIDSRFESGTDIKAFSDNKQKEINEQKNIWEEEMRRDIFYIKSSLWKVELMVLIIIFLVSTFFPNFIFEGQYQSDLINVVTVFTLFILYWDKRALWKELKK